MVSKTALVAEYVLAKATGVGESHRHFRLRDIPAHAILGADTTDPVLAAVSDALQGAHGVIVATPIYKASFSGLLKAFFDALPQFALAGKVVLPIATGGTLAHVLALDYGLRPVLQSMGARHIVQSHFVAEADLHIVGGVPTLSAQAEGPLLAAIGNFRHSLTTDPQAALLGHPRPDSAAPRDKTVAAASITTRGCGG